MKYWEGIGPKAGQCGAMDDNGSVPNSVEITKAKYDKYVAVQPLSKQIEEIIEYEDVNTGTKYRMKRL